MTKDYSDMNGTWDDFIGVHWTPDEFRVWVSQRNIEGGMVHTVREYIEYIVRSVYDDWDFWWDESDYREVLRASYPDPNEVVEDIMTVLTSTL